MTDSAIRGSPNLGAHRGEGTESALILICLGHHQCLPALLTERAQIMAAYQGCTRIVHLLAIACPQPLKRNLMDEDVPKFLYAGTHRLSCEVSHHEGGG